MQRSSSNAYVSELLGARQKVWPPACAHCATTTCIVLQLSSRQANTDARRMKCIDSTHCGVRHIPVFFTEPQSELSSSSWSEVNFVPKNVNLYRRERREKKVPTASPAAPAFSDPSDTWSGSWELRFRHMRCDEYSVSLVNAEATMKRRTLHHVRRQIRVDIRVETAVSWFRIKKAIS